MQIKSTNNKNGNHTGGWDAAYVTDVTNVIYVGSEMAEGFAERGYDAFLAVGFAGLAYVTAMQNEPVMGFGQQFCRYMPA